MRELHQDTILDSMKIGVQRVTTLENYGKAFRCQRTHLKLDHIEFKPRCTVPSWSLRSHSLRAFPAKLTLLMEAAGGPGRGEIHSVVSHVKLSLVEAGPAISAATSK